MTGPCFFLPRNDSLRVTEGVPAHEGLCVRVRRNLRAEEV